MTRRKRIDPGPRDLMAAIPDNRLSETLRLLNKRLGSVASVHAIAVLGSSGSAMTNAEISKAMDLPPTTVEAVLRELKRRLIVNREPVRGGRFSLSDTGKEILTILTN